MSIGIADLGVYLPRTRLKRQAIAAANAWAAPVLQAHGSGTIAAANWDEDSVTMAHEAARRIQGEISAVQFCSTTMPFADRLHASLLVEALRLAPNTTARDNSSSMRAATTVLLEDLRAERNGSLIVAADKRLAKPGSLQEITRGDAGVAVRISDDELLAEFVGGDTLATDFVDHYRAADSDFDYDFEARWIRDEGFLKHLPGAVKALLDRHHIGNETIKHLVLNAPARVRAGVARTCELTHANTTFLADTAIGDTGCVAPLLGLAEALQSCEAGDLLLVIGFGQGADLLLLRATGKQTEEFSTAIERGVDDENYLRYLSHRGQIEMDWGKRAERDVRTAQSAYYRERDQIAGLVGGKCASCDTLQFPRTRACVNPECRAFDTQEPEPIAELTGAVKSFTEDWQAYSPAPPLIYGNISFSGGANIMMQFTDTDAGETGVGDAVDLHFRIKDIDRARHFRRYFWKAIRQSGATNG